MRVRCAFAVLVFLGVVSDLVFGAEPQPGTVEVVTLSGDVKLELVWIPGGTFQMGCSPGDSECSSTESPRHQVTVDGFWLGKYEVTQHQWKAVMGSNPSRFKGADRPVENVSWNDVQEFERKAGKGLRLPTEAEWEYAARGGTEGPYYGNLDDIAWYGEGLEEREHHQVGQKRPNRYGLYDMLGNVWEWTEDRYGSQYDASSAQRNPTGPSSGSSRVRRGGSWRTNAERCRVSSKSRYRPGRHKSDIGFRLARDAR